MEFKKLEQGKINEIEKKYSDYFEKEKIFEKSLENKKKKYVFYDGPATANGMPGIHHMLAKLIKDTVCKYKTMQGYKVVRKVGWDTHGLPVEVQVEKELGEVGPTEFDLEEFRQGMIENLKGYKKPGSDEESVYIEQGLAKGLSLEEIAEYIPSLSMEKLKELEMTISERKS